MWSIDPRCYGSWTIINYTSPFYGTNYAYWKVCLRAFLQSLDEKVWLVVKVGWTKPTNLPTSWDDDKIKAANFNNWALNANDKKFIKNANVKANDKDYKQSWFSQFKSQDKFKIESKEVGQSSNTPAGPKCYRC